MTAQVEKRKRKRWSAEEKRALLVRWRASGLSARQFAPREGVSPANLLRWRSSAVATPERGAVKFTPVQVVKTESLRAEQTPTRAVLELVLHGGARVRVLDGADVRMISELVLAVARGA
jgi:transposase-like protein